MVIVIPYESYRCSSVVFEPSVSVVVFTASK